MTDITVTSPATTVQVIVGSGPQGPAGADGADGAGATLGISNTNSVKIDSGSVANDEYARFTANGLESRSVSEVLSDIGGQAALTFGKSSGNSIKSEAALDTNDFLRVGTTHVVGRTNAEVLSDIGGQAADAELTAIAGLTSAADKGIQFTGSGSAAVYDLTAAGKALLDDADAAAQRTTLGVTNAGSYTGHIETGAVKEFTLDPAVVTARTITAVFIQSGNQSGSAGGTGTIILKVKPSGGSNATIGTVSVSNSSGAPGSLANTSIAANARLFLDCTANSSMTDVIFSVEYTE